MSSKSSSSKRFQRVSKRPRDKVIFSFSDLEATSGTILQWGSYYKIITADISTAKTVKGLRWLFNWTPATGAAIQVKWCISLVERNNNVSFITPATIAATSSNDPAAPTAFPAANISGIYNPDEKVMVHGNGFSNGTFSFTHMGDTKSMRKMKPGDHLVLSYAIVRTDLAAAVNVILNANIQYVLLS